MSRLISHTLSLYLSNLLRLRHNQLHTIRTQYFFMYILFCIKMKWNGSLCWKLQIAHTTHNVEMMMNHLSYAWNSYVFYTHEWAWNIVSKCCQRLCVSLANTHVIHAHKINTTTIAMTKWSVSVSNGGANLPM